MAAGVLDERTLGILEGLKAYAWWKDGTQYVGTTGTTLIQAQERLLRERGFDPADWTSHLG